MNVFNLWRVRERSTFMNTEKVLLYLGYSVQRLRVLIIKPYRLNEPKINTFTLSNETILFSKLKIK